MKDLNELLQQVKAHPDFGQAGMVLAHNGVVRETSRDGRRVSGLAIKVDRVRLQEIITRQRATPGIVDIQVEIHEGADLAVGDDVMYLVVAGDIRENVLAVLTDTLNDIKATVTAKTEYFVADDS